MAILFLVEVADGKVKKASFETTSYAAAYAKQIGKKMPWVLALKHR